MRRYFFAAACIAFSWYAMQGVHELGHVLGAVLSGGTVQYVVLHPLQISRTEIAPNPHPGFTVWMGPIIGTLVPALLYLAIPRRLPMVRATAQFVAGFCLIANGAYIGVAAFRELGDAGEMLRTGSPRWVLVAFGAVAFSLGLWWWHQLGSPIEFLRGQHGDEIRP